MPKSERNPCAVSMALENVRRMVALCRQSHQFLTHQTPIQPIRSVGVIGAGIMGTAIAVEHAAHSIPVVLMDKDSDALRRAAATAATELTAIERSGRALPQNPITYTLDDTDLRNCDLVLESIIESRPVKQAIYAQIKSHLADGAILATNTSTIPIARLTTGQKDPSRFCGLHFCHPVRQRPLVEVIPGSATSPSTMATILVHAITLGKLPLIVADGPGFIVNRLLLTYLNEALALVIMGVPIQQIDAAMVEYGMPMGPLELLDEIGLDTALHSGIVLGEVLGEPSAGSELLVKLVKGRQYGTKSGKGFYNYPTKAPNPICNEIAAALRTSWATKRVDELDRASVPQRLLRPMLAEATRMLAEKRVDAAWQIDLAMIFGLGFPLWRGGLIGPNH
jgi:3-hydroxyacyl-CoA dehydrogenase